jgi:hypothetical protein
MRQSSATRQGVASARAVAKLKPNQSPVLGQIKAKASLTLPLAVISGLYSFFKNL